MDYNLINISGGKMNDIQKFKMLLLRSTIIHKAA